jgi:hypothetical protein
LSTGVSVSLALAPLPVAGVAVTLLTTLPVIDEANVTGTLKVSVLPAPALMLAPVAPALVPPAMPVTVPQWAVPATAQVTGPLRVTPVGRLSTTLTPVALPGPVLPTTMT